MMMMMMVTIIIIIIIIIILIYSRVIVVIVDSFAKIIKFCIMNSSKLHVFLTHLFGTFP